MNARLLLLVAMLAGLTGAGADEANAPMDAAASGFELRFGALQVHLYPDEIAWLNGKRWPTHEDDATMLMREGDVFTTASPIMWHDVGKPSSLPPGDIYQYRLDKLTNRVASFTLRTFDAKTTQLTTGIRQYALGLRRTESRFEVDVTQPHFLFGLDFGPNHLESSNGKAQRSK